MTLLKGNSGRGKSTILRALAWLLYGKPKLPATPKKVTVRMQMVDNLYIIRNTQPEQLTVTYIQDQTYTYNGEGAQKFINAMFGEYRTWLSTSYIAQKKINSFLEEKKDTKIDILNSITYAEDPKQYVEKITAYANQQYSLFEQLKYQYSAFEHVYKQTIGNFTFREEWPFLDSETVNAKNAQLEELRINYQQLVQAKQKREEQMAVLKSLQQQLSNCHAPKVVPEMQVKLKEEELRELLSKVVNEKINPPNTIYTEENYKQAIQSEERYCQYQRFLQQLSGYSLTNFINLKEIVEEYSKLQASNVPPALLLLGKVPVLPNDKYISPYVLTEFECPPNAEHLNSKIAALHQSIHLAKQQHICPHCQNPVIFVNNKLQSGVNTDIVESEQQLNELRKQLVLYDKWKLQEQTKQLAVLDKEKWENDYKWKMQKYQQEKDAYEKTVAENEKRQVATNEYQEVKKRINELLRSYPNLPKIASNYTYLCKQAEQQVVVELPTVTAQQIKDNIQQQERYQRYLQKNKEFTDCCAKYDTTSEPTVWKQQLQEVIKHKQEMSTYEKLQAYYLQQVQSLQQQIDNIQITPLDKQDEITKISTQMIDIAARLEYNKRLQNVLEQQNNINECYKKLQEQQQLLIACQELQQDAQVTIYELLEENIVHINSSLRYFCDIMFQYKLHAELKLFYTNKQKVERPKVCLEITNGTMKCDNYKQLSGGEQDRLSLALTLAFNLCTGSKILMLDETIHSLGTADQNLVLSALEKLENRTIISIMHNGNDAIFHKVINV
jgi:DNA repair exonuclease SbcCD ATPase subunit